MTNSLDISDGRVLPAGRIRRVSSDPRPTTDRDTTPWAWWILLALPLVGLFLLLARPELDLTELPRPVVEAEAPRRPSLLRRLLRLGRP